MPANKQYQMQALKSVLDQQSIERFKALLPAWPLDVKEAVQQALEVTNCDLKNQQPTSATLAALEQQFETVRVQQLQASEGQLKGYKSLRAALRFSVSWRWPSQAIKSRSSS